MTICSEVMDTRVKFVTPALPVDKVAELMKAQDLKSVLVVENHVSKKLVGVIGERDLVYRVIAEGRHPLTTKVCEVMRRNPIAVSAGDDVQKALDRIREHRLLSLPVVDESKALMGIIHAAETTSRALRDKEAS